MSSLAKTYALGMGVKIDLPYLFEQFFPTDWPVHKMVLLHAGAGAKDGNGQSVTPAKIYDFYDEVVKMLLPEFEKAGYKIFQIGGAKEYHIGGTTNLCGETTIAQTAYLLKNCALLIGNDSRNAHIAGGFGTPLVALYGPTDVKNHGPEWKNADKTILLESHRFGAKRPSYQSSEPEKTINVIPPESVANAALKILGLTEISRKSLFIGSVFRNQILEVVPDTQLRPEFFPNVGIAVRMDYFHSEDGLAANLMARKCSIFLDKEFNLDILRATRDNVLFCRVRVENDGRISPNFVRNLLRMGIPCSFYTEESDEVKLKSLRYKFFDYTLLEKPKFSTIEDFKAGVKKYTNSDFPESLDISGLTYKSNKYLISSKGIFLNRAAWEFGSKISTLGDNNQKIGKLIESPFFWRELKHYYIYE